MPLKKEGRKSFFSMHLAAPPSHPPGGDHVGGAEKNGATDVRASGDGFERDPIAHGGLHSLPPEGGKEGSGGPDTVSGSFQSPSRPSHPEFAMSIAVRTFRVAVLSWNPRIRVEGGAA